jgi:hypothetical protein
LHKNKTFSFYLVLLKKLISFSHGNNNLLTLIQKFIVLLKTSEHHNYDLRLLQQENQSLVENVQRVISENEKLSLVSSQLRKSSEFINAKYCLNEFDLDDLCQSYKDACAENARLKQNMRIFIEKNKGAASYIKPLEITLNHQNNYISILQIENDTLLKKVNYNFL